MSDLPPPPPGFVLSAPGGVPPPPPGFVLKDAQPVAPAMSAPAADSPVPAAAVPRAPTSTRSMTPGSLRVGQESLAATWKREREAQRLKEGYDPTVDYGPGTSFGDAVQMKRMDGPVEQRAHLESQYGKGNVFQDKRGSFFVQTKEGKRVAVEGEGVVTDILADLYGKAPQIAGGAVGAVLGAPGGIPGVLGGAALGAGAGKAADEAIKLLFGQQRKTFGQQMGALGQAGVEGAAGEAGGRLITAIPGAAGRFFRNKVAGVTPEGVSLNQSIGEAGGVAPARSLLPGLTSMSQTQDISTRLGSNFLEERNRSAVRTRLSDIIEGAGKSPDQVRAELGEILDPTARVSSREAGAPIVGAARRHASQLEGEVANLARDADTILSGQLGRLNALSQRLPAGDLGADVAGGITAARSRFSQTMQGMYAKVDELIAPAMAPTPSIPHPRYPGIQVVQPQVTGVVPTALMKKRAAEILDELPKDAQGNPIFGDARVLRSLQQMTAAPEKWPLGEAQRARSTLGEYAAFTDLTPGVAKRQFDELRVAVDQGITAAGMDPAAAPAVRALRLADEAYSKGIRKFEDAQINRIVTRARTGIAPDPGKVAELVLRPGERQRAETIKGLVGDPVWRRVAAADWENNIIGPALDKQTGEVSARRLATAVQSRDRSGLLDLAYGRAVARDIRLYSQRLDARGGKVPTAGLTPDNFGNTMRQLEIAQREQDVFLRTNYLSELAKPGPLDDGAVNFVLQNETRLIEAERFFGNASPQMTGIRDQARKELLNSAITTTQSGNETTVLGKGIESALAKLTPRQQEILFQGQVEDIKRLAKEVNFMFPVGNQDALAGGLIAGGIKKVPIPLRWAASGPIIAWSWLFSQPATMRVLSEGLKPGPGQAATRESVRMIFRAAAAGALDDSAEQPPPVSEQITDARHARPAPAPPPRQPRNLPAAPRRPSAHDITPPPGPR